MPKSLIKFCQLIYLNTINIGTPLEYLKLIAGIFFLCAMPSLFSSCPQFF